MGEMDKTVGYWIEKLLPVLLGIIISMVSFRNWSEFGFLNSEKFLENIVSIFSTLLVFYWPYSLLSFKVKVVLF